MVTVSLVREATRQGLVRAQRQLAKQRVAWCKSLLACALLALLAPESLLWGNLVANHAAIERIGYGLFVSAAQAAEPNQLIGSAQFEQDRENRFVLVNEIGCAVEELQCGQVDAQKRNVIIIGDSIGVDAYNIFRTAYPDINFILMRKAACSPFELGIVQGENCAEANVIREKLLQALASVKDMIIAIDVSKDSVSGLKEYISRQAAEGRRLVVLGMIEGYTREVPDIYRRLANEEAPRPSLATFYQTPMFAFDPELEQLTKEKGGTYIQRGPFFCPGGACRDYTLDLSDVNIVDRKHLTYSAAKEFAAYIKATYLNLF